jgi:hypothetical protein
MTDYSDYGRFCHSRAGHRATDTVLWLVSHTSGILSFIYHRA